MAETPPLRKFMFDHSFDGTANAQRPAERTRPPVTLKPEQVDALKKESFDIGFAAGQKAGADEHAVRVKTTLEQIDHKLAHMIDTIQILQKEQDKQLRESILTIARKVLPNFTAQNGLQEIEAVLSAALSEMVHEPRLVVRLHESQVDSLNEKVQEISAQKAYAGKIIVLADAEIAVGDCRIEWADGGMERNVATTMQIVEDAVLPESEPKPALDQETNNG